MEGEAKNKNIGILIVLLVVLAVIVGYAVYQQSLKPGQEEQVQPTSPSAPQVPPAPVTFPNLTEEENTVIKVPAENAREAEKVQYTQLLEKLANDVERLDLSNCTPKPVVVRIKNGKNLTITNQGEDEITATVGDNTYTIDAGANKVVEAGFGKGVGLFGYGCNSSTEGGSGSGLIWVIE